MLNPARILVPQCCMLTAPYLHLMPSHCCCRWNASPSPILGESYASKTSLAHHALPVSTAAASTADLLGGKQALRRGWGTLFGLAQPYQRLDPAHTD